MQTGDDLLPAEARRLHNSSSCRDQEQQSAVQDACRVHSSQHQPREQQEQQQHRSLYVFNVEGRRWNAPLLLGLLDHFERLYTNVVGTSVSACARHPTSCAQGFLLMSFLRATAARLGSLSCAPRPSPGVQMQGFFQPIAGMPFKGSATGLPRHVELLHSVFSLRGDPRAMLGVSR